MRTKVVVLLVLDQCPYSRRTSLGTYGGGGGAGAGGNAGAAGVRTDSSAVVLSSESDVVFSYVGLCILYSCA